MSSAQPTTKPMPLVAAYVLAAAFALAWRALVLPWDFGGFFIQFMATAFGVMVFIAAKPPAQGRLQRTVFYTLFTVSCGLWSFEAYYDPQAAVPFVIACFVLALVWAGDKRTKVKLVNTLWAALPVAGLLAYGTYSTIPIYRLRHFDPARVRAVELEPPSAGVGGGTKVELSSAGGVAEFVSALRETAPYSPNHEGDSPAWRVTLTLNSGEKVSFRLIQGVRGNRDTCRLELAAGSYQNRTLCRLLRPRVPESTQN